MSNPTEFPLQETPIILQGPAGKLEAIANTPIDNPKPITAIICHPHPLHQGTMTNKVVSVLHRTMRDLGMRTVRFNFRGVGQSEGSYGETIGETEDCLAVYNWVKQVRPDDAIWLAGFSFGSYIAANVASQKQVAGLISIAPPVTRCDFNALLPINCPWIVAQGHVDDVVLAHDVLNWYEQLAKKPQLLEFPDAGHFFHGKLIELREQLNDTIVKFI